MTRKRWSSCALGVAPEHIQIDQAEQATLFRAMLAGKRVLLVLDDAADEAHVHPLLAAGTGCLPLITFRQALAGLKGVRWLWLDPLESAGAIGLPAGIVGRRPGAGATGGRGITGRAVWVPALAPSGSQAIGW